MNLIKLNLLLVMVISPVFASAQQFDLSIDAGDFDRIDSITTFSWPIEGEKADSSSSQIYADNSGEFLVRVKNGVASMVVQKMKKGENLNVSVAKISSSSVVPALYTDKKDDGKLSFYKGLDNIPMEYFIKARFPREGIDPLYLRSGYLHPIKTPSGINVADDYPEMHIHHHGVWYTWTKTKFESRTPDFWNMGQGKGRVEHVDLLSHWDGPVHAGFKAKLRFVDMTAQPEKEVLTEEWSVRMYAAGLRATPYNVFDLHSSQTNVTNSKLELPQYRYGGLGFRGRAEWNGKENCFFLTSNGETDRIKAHTTKANWCHIGGLHEGKMVGIAILCHPGNFRAPQPMRVHPNEPFFNFAPSQGGDWSIGPGETYTSQYRFVVTDGEPNVDLINRLWNDYASPIKVSVKNH